MFDFVRQYVRTRIVAPVQQAFQDGMHPTDIAASFTLGALSGLWPIPGTTVVITFLLCYLARAVTSDWSVSIVLAQVCNLVLTPVELALIPFFLRAGEFALQSNDPIDASVLLSSGIVDIIKSSSTAFVRAVIGWVLVSPFLGMVLYFAMVPIITRLLVIRRQYGVIKQ
eukprot:m.518065 g.518065  ORF g.518065 m.518065 type:complete len:169 (+) comp57483_c0_seq23:113-619(+)